MKIVHHLTLILTSALLSACATVPPASQTPVTASAAKAPGEVVDFSKLTTRPKPIRYAVPTYPKAAVKAKLSGRVVVRFLIDEQGIPRNPECLEASDPIFEGPALAAVCQWRFSPARLNGRPVATTMQVPLNFEPK